MTEPWTLELAQLAPPTLAQLAERIAWEHEMSLAELKGPRRTARHCAARHRFAAEARALMTEDGEPRYSMAQIGRFLGGRSHVAILWAIRSHVARQSPERVCA